jgi:uncharacterized membrane protein
MLSQILDILIPAILLALVVGSAILWRKTKRLSVLLQLIAFALSFGLVAVNSVAKCLSHVGRFGLVDAIHKPTAVSVTLFLFGISFAAFSAGYIWYAVTRERI